MEAVAGGIGGLNQRTISLPIREQRMFSTSVWAAAPTGSPYCAPPIQHFVMCFWKNREEWLKPF
jgi:hypothetical protein